MATSQEHRPREESVGSSPSVWFLVLSRSSPTSRVAHPFVCLSPTPADQLIQVVIEAIQRARNRNLGVFHPSFNLSKHLREALEKYLPANVHQLISGKVSISLTRVSDLENVLVSDFESKDEVVDVSALCGCCQIRQAVSSFGDVTERPVAGHRRHSLRRKNLVDRDAVCFLRQSDPNSACLRGSGP